VLALFAVEAVCWAVACMRERRTRALALAGGIALPLFALTNCDAFLRSDPAAYESKLRAEEHYFRGTALGNEMGRPEEAKRELEAALALEPDFVSISFNLAQIYAREGDLATALRLFATALAITERSPAERFLEPAVRENLRVISEKLAADAAQPEPIRRFAEGIACLDQSRWNCAIAALRAASAADRQEQVAPLLGLALFERGGEQLRAGNDAAAVPDLSEAARLRPHDARVHVELGVALVRVGRPGKARSEFAKFRIYDLPQGDFYRSALESGNDADRVIALAAARAILRQFPRDPLAREAVQLLAK